MTPPQREKRKVMKVVCVCGLTGKDIFKHTINDHSYRSSPPPKPDKSLFCSKHNRILIGKKKCVDCSPKEERERKQCLDCGDIYTCSCFNPSSSKYKGKLK